MLFTATLCAALIAHFILCYPAAVSRGYPPINPFWEYVAIYLAFLAPMISPAFEDFSDSPMIRKGILSIFAVVAAVIAAVPLTNMAGAHPHIGHLAGYIGVWRYDFAMIFVNTIAGSVVAVPFVICLDSISRTIWDKIRTLPQPTACQKTTPSTTMQPQNSGPTTE